jgi:meiotic recombination protein SPO11
LDFRFQGKGYPDLNTRLLLKKLYDQHKLPIYALTDADPHGIEIMFTYRFGSLAQSHNAEHLAIPSIRWIGVHPSDIEKLQLPALQLTVEDDTKLKSLVKRPYMNEDLHREVQFMVTTKLKAEIEGVSSIGMNYLIDEYIPKKMNDNIVI